MVERAVVLIPGESENFSGTYSVVIIHYKTSFCCLILSLLCILCNAIEN